MWPKFPAFDEVAEVLADPPPTLDLTIPAVRQAVDLIIIELKVVRLQQPEMTPCEQLQEARRRSAEAMVHAADVMEGRKIVMLRGTRQGAHPK
jgi:hypothetical protein